MENAGKFRDKMARGQVCLGTCITFTDAAVTEALSGVFDFVWIDMEHGALSLETAQAHVMATKGSDAAPLVRVAWNDPVLIKPVLDLGAAGVIVPLVRTAEDVARAVAACRYPPLGVRGYGPRRPSRYGQAGGKAFCEAANAAVLPIAQIEHLDAVNNLDAILAVSGLAALVVGPNDLSGSMGHMGEPGHPEVRAAIETVLAKGRRAKVPVGIGTGDDAEALIGWFNRGAQWLLVGADFTLLLKAASQTAGRVREHLRGTSHSSGER
jgi:2-dehydro-3-deoxyglucarate aldolase/4-hydroxy-2-oxoheptanedioate aldolase